MNRVRLEYSSGSLNMYYYVKRIWFRIFTNFVVAADGSVPVTLCLYSFNLCILSNLEFSTWSMTVSSFVESLFDHSSIAFNMKATLPLFCCLIEQLFGQKSFS